MNTSEVLDLSKENIQPLKQGRHAEKLGTALQAQTNVELHQQLLAERERFELLIRMYEGDDPLEPHYDYVNWIEQSFPKHGPDSNIVQILENALTTFKDDERYKQDLRYAELLVKYIDTQPNPVQIYQIVYDQGLCTMCAPFYKAWADELDKNNDLKGADKIYELGIMVKAQPLDMLKEAHLRFQLSVGRRLLGRQEEMRDEDPEYNRQALHKLQKRNIHSVRDPTGAPGQVKQLGNSNRNVPNSAPFKIYEGDDDENNMYGDRNGKMFPKQALVNKENTLKAGPWSQGGGKHRSKTLVTSASKPTFQVHEDEDADLENGHHRTSSVPRALKPRKLDDFTCPLAVFESPDPTKLPMYCKNKVYAGGREFQFEELRAALYNRRYEQLAELKKQQDARNESENVKHSIVENETYVLKTNSEDSGIKTNLLMKNFEGNVSREIGSVQGQQFEPFPITNNQSQEHEGRHIPLEANTSLSHSQSFTVNTKEAMNVVQEMWNSPSPATGSAFRASRAFPPSPANLDESGVFKVPPVPPPPIRGDDAKTPTKTPKSAVKNTPSFPIFSDDDQEPVPTPKTTTPSFQVYFDSEESDSAKSHKTDSAKSHKTENKNIEPRTNENINKGTTALPFHLSQPAASIENRQSKVDSATLKMLAFQSDSDDSGEDESKMNTNGRDAVPYFDPPVQATVPTVAVTAPTPVEENKRRSLDSNPVPHQLFQDEDRYEDMTCNTKAFDFVLPSSTPLVGHKSSSQAPKNFINGSYICDEVKKNVTKQELSMIFEASKERYSSSSGSSGCKTQGSNCTAANTSMQPGQLEVMEKLAQISANNSGDLERSFANLSMSGPVDPFSTELITRLLSKIYPKKHHLIGLHRFDTDAPAIHTNSTVKLGNTKYSVIGELGKGNYARVLKATRDGQPVALKQQRPAWEWEWYIVQELQSRLPPNMMGGFLHMSNGYIFKNGSILESEWAQYGSLLSVVNKMKIAGKSHDIHLSLLLSIQLISIVEHLHKCKIIHGDIKPDNFVLCSMPTADNSTPYLKLIDFGRSIDMTLLPEGTTFNVVVTTDGFQCNEMKEGRPWTYQTDLYGLAGSIYCVLFYDYMKVVKKDKWQLSNKIPRYMMPGLWQDIFSSLLNVESCENLPDLSALREKLDQSFKAMDPATINQSITKLSNVLLNK